MYLVDIQKVRLFFGNFFFYDKQVIVDTCNRLWLDQAITKWKSKLNVHKMCGHHTQQRTSKNDDDLHPKLDG